MRVFFDRFALVKRYVREAGTDAVLQWRDQATEIALSCIALPELVSSFCGLQREAKVTPASQANATILPNSTQRTWRQPVLARQTIELVTGHGEL